MNTVLYIYIKKLYNKTYQRIILGKKTFPPTITLDKIFKEIEF